MNCKNCETIMQNITPKHNAFIDVHWCEKCGTVALSTTLFKKDKVNTWRVPKLNLPANEKVV